VYWSLNIKIKCPNCGEIVIIKLDGSKILSITLGNSIATSQSETVEILKQKKIELG